MYKPETTFANGKHPLGMTKFFKPTTKIKRPLAERLYGQQLKTILTYIKQNGPSTSSQITQALNLLPSSISQIRDAKFRGLIRGVWGSKPASGNRLMYYSEL